MAHTLLLFDPADLPPAVRYEKLFGNLPRLQENFPKVGRPPISRNSLLKALIYSNLRRLATLSDLEFELNNNPSMAQVVGLNPLGTAPSVERFSSFLRDTNNEDLQQIRRQLVIQLIKEDVISGSVIVIDSCPIVVQVRENNLKTAVANRFDKERRPAGDPEARLGVMIHYPKPFQKEVRYFWGYRNHAVCDFPTELPILEITKPANVSEIKMAIPIIKQAQQIFNLSINIIIGDTAYDSEDLLRFIIKELKAEAVIPHNPRNQQQKGYHTKGNQILCEAGLPMYRKGKMRPKRTGILYCQYSCPIYYDKKIRYQYIICPVYHPKFLNGKGCNTLIRLEPSIRAEIDYGSERFKELYNSRTSVERVFSRLLSIAMQNPTVKGLKAISNHCTIAHITVLLVALTAHRSGQQDKIRFVKSFVPNFLH